MFKSLGKRDRVAFATCIGGIFLQAMCINIVPLLFIPLRSAYGLSYAELGILVGSMFIIQIVADTVCSLIIDKVGYRALAIPCSILAFAGLLMFSLVPYLFGTAIIFWGFLLATSLSAFAAGMLEVIVSPLAESLPFENKAKTMALVHSSYAWGQIMTIIVTTIMLSLIGYQNWQFIVMGWAVLSACMAVLFISTKYPPVEQSGKLTKKSTLLKNPYYILCMLAICFGGASEVLMNQWASAYLESSLALPKLVGDLLGMCGFALMLGLGRLMFAFKGKNMNKALVLGSMFTILCYLITALSPFNMLNIIACAATGLTTSLLWPGTLTIASRRFPMAGGFLFGVLAIMGDLGAAVAPSFAGGIMDSAINLSFVKFLSNLFIISPEQAAMRFAILICTVFPIIALIIHLIIAKLDKNIAKLPSL